MLSLLFVIFLATCTSAFDTSNLTWSLSLISDWKESIRSKQDNLDPQCAAHLLKWTGSFESLAEELSACKDHPEPSLCKKKRLNILHEHAYALFQIDAFGKIPANILGLRRIWMGDYDECIDVHHPSDTSYRTQFCWAHIYFPIKELMKAINLPFDQVDFSCGQDNVADVKWSVCMPKSCSEQDIVSVLNFLPKNLGFDTVCSVTCRQPDKDYSSGFWIVTIILAFFTILVIFATILEYYGKEGNKCHKKNHHSSALEYILCFSALSNGRSILCVSVSNNNINGLDCIRFFTFTWIISCHFFAFWIKAENSYTLVSRLHQRIYDLWLSAYVSVDTFFFLSGLMLSYLFITKNNVRSIKNPYMWSLFYVHRYVRLTVPYAMFLLFYAVMVPYVDSGPNEAVNIRDATNCRSSWWMNMLYINNVMPYNKECFGISWYLAADTQMFAFSPLFLVPFLFSPILGFTTLFCVLLFSTGISYIDIITLDLPITVVRAITDNGGSQIHEFMLRIYKAFYIRIPPYLVGIGTGYLFSVTKDTRIFLNKGLVTLLWLFATSTSLSVLFSLHSYNNGVKWNSFVRASYYVLSRLAWPISLAWLVFAINKGYGGIIGDVMSHPFWTPLGRLTYCGYLCHIFIIYIFLTMETNAFHYVGIIETYTHWIIPVVLLTLCFALFWSLLFEIPSNRLETIFLRKLGIGTKEGQQKDITVTKI